MYNVRMRSEGAKGRGRVVRGLLDTNPANSTLATDLDVFLLSIQRKEEKEMKFWEEGWGIYLVHDHSKIVGVLEMRAILPGITRSQK